MINTTYNGNTYYIENRILSFSKKKKDIIELNDFDNECLISLVQDRADKLYYIYWLKYKNKTYNNYLIIYDEDEQVCYRLTMNDLFDLMLQSHMTFSSGTLSTDGLDDSYLEIYD